MKRIVPQYYIDKVEDARQELFHLAEKWELDDTQMAQLRACVTEPMFKLTHRKFKDYRFDRQGSNKAGHRLGITKETLVKIKNGDFFTPAEVVSDDPVKCLEKCQLMARQTLWSIKDK